MRHRKRNVKFGRHQAHRKATLEALLASLILYKRIETTLTKAKEAKRLADRLITWAKKGTLHHRRMAYSVLGDRDLVSMLFKDLAPLFANRQGGYTRVIHTRKRPGDNAQLAILEWTEKKKEEPVPAKKKPKKPARPEVSKTGGEEAKPEVKAKKERELPEEKPKARPVEEKKKGLLGGLRKFFQRKSPG